MTAIFVVLGACSGTDETQGTDEPTSTTDTSVAIAAEPAFDSDHPDYLAPVDRESDYVTALCSLDFDAAYAAADPVGKVIEQLRSVPTEDVAQSDELTSMIDTLESVDDTSVDDPDSFAAILEVGVVLEARCG